MATQSNSELQEQPVAIKSVSQVRLKEIRYNFDERSWDKFMPLDSKHGMVQVIFTDSTAAGLSCTRDTFASSLVKIINTKLEGNDLITTDPETKKKATLSRNNNLTVKDK